MSIGCRAPALCAGRGVMGALALGKMVGRSGDRYASVRTRRRPARKRPAHTPRKESPAAGRHSSSTRRSRWSCCEGSGASSQLSRLSAIASAILG